MNGHRLAWLFPVVACLTVLASLAGATGAGALTFAPPVDYGVGARPADIASADLNGDGRPDLVASAGQGVAVLLATSPGRFAPATRIDLGHKTGAVALADVNGDGGADIVAVCPDDDLVTVLLGDGHGVFVLKGAYPAGDEPMDVVVGDMTGDGKADVAAADALGDGLGVLKGDGTGALQAPLDFPVGADCRRLVGADLNGDGTMDLACSRYSWEEYGGFRVLLADGSGGFTPAGEYEIDSDSGPHGMALANLNGDGKADLVVLYGYEGGRTFAYLGDGLGVFIRVSTVEFRGGLDEANGLAVARMDHDGSDDVVTSGYTPGGSSGTMRVPQSTTRIYILLGSNGGGAFRTRSFPARRTVGELVAADLNGDHKTDLAWTDVKSDNVSVRLNGRLPVLTGVSPAQGRVGAAVALTGAHFTKRGTTVRFGGVPATGLVSWSPTRIEVKVPAGTPKGRVKVTVTTQVGRTAPRSFTRL
ncbi:MAG TPA: FG-GAP-like repeat-containing protein [Thermoleophilia bacterium]|nr:FG-GAP-like repeat-containing protein [Thermoleophilia bacterium]